MKRSEIHALELDVRCAEISLENRRRQLREAIAKCDHRFANGQRAFIQKSTHDVTTCGGYHECAVCAGEQPETFVEMCRICKKTGEPFTINFAAIGKRIRL